MGVLQEDTNNVRQEFDALSTPTQVFIAVLVGLGVIIGVLLAGAIAYGVTEIEGEECIEFGDQRYCAEETDDGE